jgi:hypothetical protein
MIFIGIDNGVSGSIGILNGEEATYIHTPVKSELSYTKNAQRISRIDGIELQKVFDPYVKENVIIFIERPLVNPMMFKATLSAMRSLEATLIVIELNKFAYRYIDSKEWQRKFLPTGLEKGELKKASLQIAQRMFPKIDYKGFADGDGLLIAAYARSIDAGTTK